MLESRVLAVMWKFGIVNVTNWVEKDGVPWTTALFKKVEYNCGWVTRWKSGKDAGGEWVYFDVPLCIVKDVEESIQPAGGPGHVDCHGHGL